METPKKQRGRPRKEKDRIEPWQFGRAAMVMCAYDDAREGGDKHSVAVSEAVNFVKLHDPEMHVSQTEVKRVLAQWRPKDSGTTLCFERKIPTKEEIERHQSMWDQVRELQGKKGLKLEVPPNLDPERRQVFAIRIAERPNYPRHNRKKHKDNPSC